MRHGLNAQGLRSRVTRGIQNLLCLSYQKLHLKFFPSISTYPQRISIQFDGEKENKIRMKTWVFLYLFVLLRKEGTYCCWPRPSPVDMAWSVCRGDFQPFIGRPEVSWNTVTGLTSSRHLLRKQLYNEVPFVISTVNFPIRNTQWIVNGERVLCD